MFCLAIKPSSDPIHHTSNPAGHAIKIAPLTLDKPVPSRKGERMAEAVGRSVAFTCPQAFRRRVLFQMITPRYSDRSKTSRTEDGAQPAGLLCCARGNITRSVFRVSQMWRSVGLISSATA